MQAGKQAICQREKSPHLSRAWKSMSLCFSLCDTMCKLIVHSESLAKSNFQLDSTVKAARYSWWHWVNVTLEKVCLYSTRWKTTIEKASRKLIVNYIFVSLQTIWHDNSLKEWRRKLNQNRWVVKLFFVVVLTSSSVTVSQIDIKLPSSPYMQRQPLESCKV